MRWVCTICDKEVRGKGIPIPSCPKCKSIGLAPILDGVSGVRAPGRGKRIVANAMVEVDRQAIIERAQDRKREQDYNCDYGEDDYDDEDDDGMEDEDY